MILFFWYYNDITRNITLILTLNNPRAPFLPLWSICNFVFCDSSGLFGNFQTLAVISRINLGLRGSARQCSRPRLFVCFLLQRPIRLISLNFSTRQTPRYFWNRFTNIKRTKAQMPNIHKQAGDIMVEMSHSLKLKLWNCISRLLRALHSFSLFFFWYLRYFSEPLTI